MTSQNSLTYVGGALLAGVIGAIVALALHGTITGQSAMTAIVVIIGIAGGAISHASGVAAGAKAADPAAGTVTPAAKP